MNSKPLKILLDRDLAKAAIPKAIEFCDKLLIKIINYAINAFGRCSSLSPGGDEYAVLLALYRHMIEMSDGVQVLISNCCPVPAKPLVRSSWESLLSLEYILKNNFKDRALGFLVDDVRRNLRMLNDLKTYYEIDEEFQQSINENNNLLEKSSYKSIESKFLEHSRNWPKWYQVFGIASNIRELATEPGREDKYVTLYFDWSSTAHGQDLTRFNITTQKGERTINPLRAPDKTILRSVTQLTTSFLLDGTKLVLGKFSPSEDLDLWYHNNLKHLYERVKLKTA